MHNVVPCKISIISDYEATPLTCYCLEINDQHFILIPVLKVQVSALNKGNKLLGKFWNKQIWIYLI